MLMRKINREKRYLTTTNDEIYVNTICITFHLIIKPEQIPFQKKICAKKCI